MAALNNQVPNARNELMVAASRLRPHLHDNVFQINNETVPGADDNVSKAAKDTKPCNTHVVPVGGASEPAKCVCVLRTLRKFMISSRRAL